METWTEGEELIGVLRWCFVVLYLLWNSHVWNPSWLVSLLFMNTPFVTALYRIIQVHSYIILVLVTSPCHLTLFFTHSSLLLPLYSSFTFSSSQQDTQKAPLCSINSSSSPLILYPSSILLLYKLCHSFVSVTSSITWAWRNRSGIVWLYCTFVDSLHTVPILHCFPSFLLLFVFHPLPYSQSILIFTPHTSHLLVFPSFPPYFILSRIPTAYQPSLHQSFHCSYVRVSQWCDQWPTPPVSLQVPAEHGQQVPSHAAAPPGHRHTAGGATVLLCQSNLLHLTRLHQEWSPCLLPQPRTPSLYPWCQ